MSTATAETAATDRATAWKGIDPAVLEAFGVTQGVVGWRVPYFDSEGTLYRVKLFAADGEHFENAKGHAHRARFLGPRKPQIPYGAWRLRAADRRALILTEGESDTWALAEHLPHIVALGVPGASSWKSGWTAALQSFGAVYLSFDADDAGRKLADAVLADHPAARHVRLPEGADTRAFLQRLGREPYLQLLREAEAVYRIRRAVNVAGELLRLAREIREGWSG